MRYVSLFSGIGGLESDKHEALAFCDIDPECRKILSILHPGIDVADDVRSFAPPRADAVVGGWPCTDLSSAGLRAGLSGKNSSLFFDMVRVARDAKAHTLIAENVPNLLSIEEGQAFNLVLSTLHENGFDHVAWRTLNVREFGLPHQRRRVIIVASRHSHIAHALHRPLPQLSSACIESPRAHGFYWTAGSQSICYSHGYVPTLKVGSSLSIPSPPAIHHGEVVRKISAQEALSLQGFPANTGEGLKDGSLYRMAGNAVARPMGEFAVNCLDGEAPDRMSVFPSQKIPNSGLSERSGIRGVMHDMAPLANNLDGFLLESHDRLSQRASSGLLRRLNKSGKPCPDDLRAMLEILACPAQ